MERRAMEMTVLALAGKKLTIPRVVKRTLQIAISVALTSLVILAIHVSDGLLLARAGSFQAATSTWLAFIQRPDILAAMTITAIVTVFFVYWQRDRERR
jgi:membrane-anchored glycerophosphoryl diester phosphodiesterase (GDPDase)